MDLEHIFDELIEDPIEDTTTESNAKIYADFELLYSDTNYRHSYYEISRYLEDLECDVSDMLDQSLINLFEYSAGINKSSEVTKKLSKLIDHVSLESLRLSRMKKVNYLETSISNNLKITLEEVNNKKQEMEEIDRKVANIHAEVITILGIFAGLVVGFSIDFQLLAQSFSNLDSVSFYKEIAYLCIIGIILFDSIFLLMFAVSRISGRSLAINCKYKDCQNCTECKHKMKILHKYPYLFWYNLILSITFILCIVVNCILKSSC
uniref:hypothetical protein n=1 Tax=uncultured Ruminococcus sp. TaxID=165186 RepID=UPI0025FD2FEC|nr:hypothetical protein [uncultured Ruminococcus sp.]